VCFSRPPFLSHLDASFVQPSLVLGADNGLRELIQAFDGRETSLPCLLEHLHMDDCDITAQGVACLGGSLRNGRFPELETLSLALNSGVREEGVRCLVTALEDMGGACKLKTLDLSWTNMTARSAGTHGNVIPALTCFAFSPPSTFPWLPFQPTGSP
jgi:hypothetical protein